MSLFGAINSETLMDILKRAKENFEKKIRESTSPSEASAVSSSYIGDPLEESTAPGPEALGRPVVLPRDIFNEAVRIHNEEAREQGHLSQICPTVHGGSSVDEEGNLVYKQPRVYTIPSDTQRSIDSQTS